MRLLALTTLTMIAFATNSVPNRLGVGGRLIDPVGFALVRLLAGALAPPIALRLTSVGVALAVASGALASGLGYALWYALLPQLGAARAAMAQLSASLLAAMAGAALLTEPMSWRFGAASALVLGGVALAVLPGRKR